MSTQLKKFNLKEVVFSDLTGNVQIKDIEKSVGNMLYTEATTIEQSDGAKAIHYSGNDSNGVMLDINFLRWAREIINLNPNLKFWIKTGLLQYFDYVIDNNVTANLKPKEEKCTCGPNEGCSDCPDVRIEGDDCVEDVADPINEYEDEEIPADQIGQATDEPKGIHVQMPKPNK